MFGADGHARVKHDATVVAALSALVRGDASLHEVNRWLSREEHHDSASRGGGIKNNGAASSSSSSSSSFSSAVPASVAPWWRARAHFAHALVTLVHAQAEAAVLRASHRGNGGDESRTDDAEDDTGMGVGMAHTTRDVHTWGVRTDPAGGVFDFLASRRHHAAMDQSHPRRESHLSSDAHNAAGTGGGVPCVKTERRLLMTNEDDFPTLGGRVGVGPLGSANGGGESHTLRRRLEHDLAVEGITAAVSRVSMPIPPLPLPPPSFSLPPTTSVPPMKRRCAFLTLRVCA